MISSRVQGTLPSNTEANPREQVQAITMMSGKELQEVEKKAKEEGKMGATLETKKEEEQSDSKKETSQQLQVPFPNRLKRHKMEKEFGKFLEIFKSLHINIPFADALAQMPHYAKFLKEILVNKKKLGDVATVALNEECSAILLNKLPQKLKDPKSFTIPCTIGSLKINKALCDLGALMPYSVFKKLGLGEPQPTRVALQLANRSIKHPRGIIEDVLVKVNRSADPLELCIQEGEAIMGENEEIQSMVVYLNSNPQFQGKGFIKLENLDRPSMLESKPSIEEPPTLELKQLPPHLEYAFLEAPSALPVIISTDLTSL
ncbi:PREDICTED: uncharacterized protein LOC104590793 [Nelumbo nucifera]|uniref:Uncharacterized protein LOC104590793 n=1 Tax=Nelumbo nucifera TaxID=4432 RepID=A0A1U7ZHY3_NELNU|nr:PREDICTED: uncharacterized protein LOC104590793 [Nelumbo nucifera]